MNTFGRLFSVSVLGESHGEVVGVLIDGCPAGLSLSVEDFAPDLSRRRPGAAGTTPRRESDEPNIKSGVFKGKTTGAPILILFENEDARSDPYEEIRTKPRPGHADFAAGKKFANFNDYRGGGHFSGRLTVGLVAAGVIAKKLLRPIEIKAEILEVGGRPDFEDAVSEAVEESDSVGGIVQCTARGIPVGLGEPFFDSVESAISHIVFSIPAIKGIEFGAGFAAARMKGSECNDAILDATGKTETNHAGGVTGGVTNGNDLVFRAAVKPTPSIPKAQKTVDLETGKPAEISITGRHDACIALRVPVILEAACAIALADLAMIEQRIPRIRPNP